MSTYSYRMHTSSPVRAPCHRRREECAVSEPFVAKLHIRYLDVDQQGVVFHMWYLAYFEDARNAFLADRGLPLPELVHRWCDVQLAHTELDWHGSVRWEDVASVRVEPTHVGTTSFTLDFGVLVDGTEIVHGRTVYVTIDPAGRKQPVPAPLRELLAREMSRLEVGP
jgi:acyl-CoA thioester hydrolase